MIKVFSLIFIYIISFFITLFFPYPAYAAACDYTLPADIDAGSEFAIQIRGQQFRYYRAEITDSGTILDDGAAQTDSSGNATITLRAPSAPATYTLRVWDDSDGNDCSGVTSITPGTNVGTCSGFLGCLGGISTPGLNFSSPATFISDLISKILPFVLGIVGFLTVIVIVISGIQFITSSGNPEAAGAARGRLQFALIGFIIVLLAFAITQIVDVIFLGGSGVF